MWNFKSHFLVLINSFALALLVVVIYVYFIIDIELGEKVGKGIFYLKGNYTVYGEINGEIKEGITEETGIGMFIIPILISIIVTFLYIVVEWCGLLKGKSSVQ